MNAMLFLLIAVALVLIALAFVVIPLVRATPDVETQADTEAADQRLAVLRHGLRELDADFNSGAVDAQEYDEARRELEQQALDADTVSREQAAFARKPGWRAALAFGVTLPVAAIILYAALGTPAALWRSAGPATTVANAPHGPAANMAAMTARLAQRLEQDSNNLDGWLLLARSYESLGQTSDAAAAYQKAVALRPDDANLLIAYANTLSIARGGLAGKPAQVIQHALEVAPDNLNALALAGAAAVQAGRPEDAVRYWTHLKDLLPADDPSMQRLETVIARVRDNGTAIPADVAIHGTVELSDALAAEVSPADTLFIYAKAANGPPMPLAIIRSSATQWPVTFTLDDGSAMMPDLHLSQYSHVTIIARVSRTGGAQPRPGDLQGRANNIAIGSEEVRIVIDHRIDG